MSDQQIHDSKCQCATCRLWREDKKQIKSLQAECTGLHQGINLQVKLNAELTEQLTQANKVIEAVKGLLRYDVINNGPAFGSHRMEQSKTGRYLRAYDVDSVLQQGGGK